MIPQYTAAVSPLLHLVFRFRRLGPTNIRPSTQRRFVMGLPNNPTRRQGCFKRALTNACKPKAVRDTMIKEWAAFSSDDKRHCVAEATMGGAQMRRVVWVSFVLL
jgi:hypothetical protein